MLRRAAGFAIAVLAACLLAGCGSHHAHARLWVSVPLKGCVSSDCGAWSITLNWQIPAFPGQTGYSLFLNGSQVGSASSSPFTFTGWDCGTANTLGVEAHDGSGGHGPLWTVSYTAPACFTPTVNYFVAQSAAGSGNGSSCANAEAVSTLSTSTEWTAGNVIGLCGTITSTITAQGSGSSGNPITVVWEPGATLSQLYCPTTGCFNTNSKTYLTLNGALNGTSIQATANGSGLTYQNNSLGIDALGCTGCTFENLTIANTYVHSSASDTASACGCGAINYSGSNVLITDNTIHDDGPWALTDEVATGNGNDTVSGNYIYNQDHGLALSTGAATGTIGPFYVYGNHFSNFGVWDTTTDTWHHDGIHCYGPASSPPHISDAYFYNNRFDGTAGANMTADIFVEGAENGSDCADSTSQFYIFNNIFDHSDQTGTNGNLALQAGDLAVFNNTEINPAADGPALYANYSGLWDLRNNLAVNGDYEAENLDPSGNLFANTTDYNMYANTSATAGNNAFVCSGYYQWGSTGLGNWRTCIGADIHASIPATSTLNLGADGSLGSGSAALAAGENLYSICSGQATPGLGALCSSYAGPPANGGAGSATSSSTRPSSGAWNVGAY